VPSIGTKIIDLGWPWMAKTSLLQKWKKFTEPTRKIWTKTGAYYQRQNV